MSDGEWGIYIQRADLDPVCVERKRTKDAALAWADTQVGYMRDDHRLDKTDRETSTWELTHCEGSTAKVYVQRIGAS